MGIQQLIIGNAAISFVNAALENRDCSNEKKKKGMIPLHFANIPSKGSNSAYNILYAVAGLQLLGNSMAQSGTLMLLQCLYGCF